MNQNTINLESNINHQQNLDTINRFVEKHRKQYLNNFVLNLFIDLFVIFLLITIPYFIFNPSFLATFLAIVGFLTFICKNDWDKLIDPHNYSFEQPFKKPFKSKLTIGDLNDIERSKYIKHPKMIAYVNTVCHIINGKLDETEDTYYFLYRFHNFIMKTKEIEHQILLINQIIPNIQILDYDKSLSFNNKLEEIQNDFLNNKVNSSTTLSQLLSLTNDIKSVEKDLLIP